MPTSALAPFRAQDRAGDPEHDASSGIRPGIVGRHHHDVGDRTSTTTPTTIAPAARC